MDWIVGNGPFGVAPIRGRKTAQSARLSGNAARTQIFFNLRGQSIKVSLPRVENLYNGGKLPAVQQDAPLAL